MHLKLKMRQDVECYRISVFANLYNKKRGIIKVTGNFYSKSCLSHKYFVEGKNSIVAITNRVYPGIFRFARWTSTMKRSRWNVKIFWRKTKKENRAEALLGEYANVRSDNVDA